MSQESERTARGRNSRNASRLGLMQRASASRDEARRRQTFSRVDAIFETRKLSGKRVAIIGLGTGGSVCADQLTRCAVDCFGLVDFDVLEIHNLARHTCGLKDLGRYKVDAVADKIRDVNPDAVIETFRADILKSPDVLEAVVRGSDLVLVCTDNNASRYAINECCLRHKVPSIYAGAFERAFGGQVIRVIPGQTPCYDCVFGALQQKVPPHGHKGPVAYSELSDPSQFKAEPGLCMDVHFIALILAKMALLTLLRGTDSALEDFPSDFVLWGNRKEWIFPEPLHARFAKVRFREDCSTCRRVRFDKQARKAMVEEARQLVHSAQCAPELFEGRRGGASRQRRSRTEERRNA